jgi:hypothetical protein
MTTFKLETLSPPAIEVLGQLFVSGPTWDGNVCSKSGRDELCRAGLAWHQHGYANLTPEGVLVAIGWDRDYLRRARYDTWREKIGMG